MFELLVGIMVAAASPAPAATPDPLAGLRQRAAANEVSAMVQLGERLYGDEGRGWLERAAGLGSAAACRDLAYRSQRDEIRTEAAGWLRKAVDLGDPTAATELASWLVAGRGLPRDYRGAVALLAPRAAKGDVDAALALRTLAPRLPAAARAEAVNASRPTLDGVREDPQLDPARYAGRMLVRAREAEAHGNLELARSLYSDVGRQLTWDRRSWRDLQDLGFLPLALAPALQALEAAGGAGSGPACYLRAQLALEGALGQEDPAQAERWLELGARLGDLPCGCLLASRHEKADGREATLARYRRLFAGRELAGYDPAKDAAVRAFELAVDRTMAAMPSGREPWSGDDLGRFQDLAGARAYFQGLKLGVPALARKAEVSDGLPVRFVQARAYGALLLRKAKLADGARAQAFLQESAAQGTPAAQYLLGLELAARPDQAISGLAYMELARAQAYEPAARVLDDLEQRLGPDAVALAQEQAGRWWEAALR